MPIELSYSLQLVEGTVFMKHPVYVGEDYRCLKPESNEDPEKGTYDCI